MPGRDKTPNWEGHKPATSAELLNVITTATTGSAKPSQSDRVLRREEIYERVWGYAMAHGDRSVDVFVRKLRQKLRSGSPERVVMETAGWELAFDGMEVTL